MIYVKTKVPDTLMIFPNEPGREGILLKGLRNSSGHPDPDGRSVPVPFSDEAAAAYERELTKFEEAGMLEITPGEPDPEKPTPKGKGSKVK